MNPITDYFKEHVQPNPKDMEKIAVLEKVIKYADASDMLEAVSCVACFESGTAELLEVYKSTPLSAEMVEFQRSKLTGTLEGLYAQGQTESEHINLLKECLSRLQEVNTIRDSDTYIYETSLTTFTEELNEAERRIVLEGPTLELTDAQVLETTLALTQAQFNVEFVKTFMGPEENFTMESVNRLMQLSNRYDDTLAELIVLEAGDTNGNGKLDNNEVVIKKNGREVDTNKPSGVQKASRAIDKGSRKATTNIRKKTNDAKAATAGLKKAGGRFKNLVGKTVDRLDEMNKEERMEAILQGGMRRRVSTVLRTAIMTGAAYAVNPALGLITLLTSAALRRKADTRLKEQVKSEYQAEIKVVQEKIRDAEAAGDRKKKYELMRIQNHLERNIERIDSPYNTNKSRTRRR